jgi:integrase/recombinase XerC
MSAEPDSKLAWIDAYLAHLRGERQLSPHTTSAYARDLQQLVQLLAALPGAPDWTQVDHFAIRRLTARLHAQELDPRSIARKLSSWRGFFTWLGGQVPLAANPGAGRARAQARQDPAARTVGR